MYFYLDRRSEGFLEADPTALLFHTLASSGRQFYLLFPSPSLWVTQWAWCRSWRRGEYSSRGAQAAEELDSYLLVTFWNTCERHPSPSQHLPLDASRGKDKVSDTEILYTLHVVSGKERKWAARVESVSWKGSPCGLRAGSLSSQAPPSQGLRAAVQATPQQPTVLGDLLLRYWQRT